MGHIFWNMAKISIIVELVQRYACGFTKEERKKRMLVLSFAIWCKLQHSNSVIFGMGVKQLMKTLHISYGKATYLLEAIKTDDVLFRTLAKGRFMVNSFRDQSNKTNKKGWKYRGTNVFTLEMETECTIKDIYNKLNELLFLRQIASEEANCSHVSRRNSCRCRSPFITMKQFQSSVGMSHGSCCAIKKRLKAKKHISSTCAEVYSADERCPKQMQEIYDKLGVWKPTFRAKCRIYVVKPCTYAITSREAKANSGRHKIYNYSIKGRSSRTAQKGMYKPLALACGMPD